MGNVLTQTEREALAAVCVPNVAARPLVIGLLGRAGSGKSTVAKHLRDKYQAQIFSFASPLKKLAAELMGFTHSQLYGTQAEKETVDPRYGFSPRQFMERLGNGAREHLGENVWRDGAFHAIREHFSGRCKSLPAALYVIDDVRYPNEAEGIHSAFGGYIVKLICPDSVSTSDPNSKTEKCVDEVPDDVVDLTLSVARSEGAATLLSIFDETVQVNQLLKEVRCA